MVARTNKQETSVTWRSLFPDRLILLASTAKADFCNCHESSFKIWLLYTSCSTSLCNSKCLFEDEDIKSKLNSLTTYTVEQWTLERLSVAGCSEQSKNAVEKFSPFTSPSIDDGTSELHLHIRRASSKRVHRYRLKCAAGFQRYLSISVRRPKKNRHNSQTMVIMTIRANCINIIIVRSTINHATSNPAPGLHAAAAQSTNDVNPIQLADTSAFFSCGRAKFCRTHVLMRYSDLDEDVLSVALTLSLFCSCLRVIETHFV